MNLRQRLLAPLLAGLAFLPLLAAPPRRPFPQALDFAGCIKPTRPQAQLDRDVWNYYRTWKKDYYRRISWNRSLGMIEGPATGDPLEGWPKGTRIISASEHTGYGMIIFALMAGKDPQAKACFDSLVRTYLAHPSSFNPVFMSWAIGDRANLPVGGSATDGDMDIAYGLCLAEAQWGGRPEGVKQSYGELAQRMIKAMLDPQGLIDPKTHFITLGDGFPRNEIKDGEETPRGFYLGESSTRPSDWLLGHLAAFRRRSPGFPEKAVRDQVFALAENPELVDPATGLPPDFIVLGRAAGETENRLRPAWRLFLGEPFETGEFHENAARVPWRFACDFAHTGDPRSRERAGKIARWITGRIGTDWGQVVNGYRRSGEPLPGSAPGDKALHFVAPMVTACATSPEFQKPLDAGWSYLRTRHVGSKRWDDDGYFKDSLTLLALLQISGNAWAP